MALDRGRQQMLPLKNMLCNDGSGREMSKRLASAEIVKATQREKKA